MRYVVMLSRVSPDPKVKHFVGLPPELTRGVDTRREMGVASYLVIETGQEGVFLFRFDRQGKRVGDTWHENLDDARDQVSYEYESAVRSWDEIPEDIEDGAAFGLALLNNRSEP